MLLIGYIDESGDGKNTFTLSCLLAEGITWTWIEVDWKNLLEAKNKELRHASRQEITRYHASDCSSCLGEFRGWSIDEQKSFTNNILEIFRKQDMLDTVAYSLNIQEMTEELPWTKSEPLEWAHRLTLNFLILELGNQIATAEPRIPVNVTLIHDRSSFSGLFIQVFDNLMKDPTFSYKKHFSTISSMGWEDCIPLQLADLMAYENFKDAERHSTKRKRRYTLNEFLRMGSFSGRSRRFDREGLTKLADVYKQINPQWR